VVNDHRQQVVLIRQSNEHRAKERPAFKIERPPREGGGMSFDCRGAFGFGKGRQILRRPLDRYIRSHNCVRIASTFARVIGGKACPQYLMPLGNSGQWRSEVAGHRAGRAGGFHGRY